MNKKLKKENRKILINIISIVLFICLLTIGTFTYLTYNFTKQIDQYQAELQSKYIYDNTKYIDITESGQINTFIVTNLNGNSSYNDIYVSLENDYYNISVDSANKMRIELDDYSSFDTFSETDNMVYNYSMGVYLDYFTLRNSMTDEQYNKIADYLNTEPDENGNYYILSVNQYATDNYNGVSTDEMIPIRLEILRTNENHVWYAEDEHIEYFDLSSDKISEIKELQKQMEENYKKNNDNTSDTVLFGPIHSIGDIKKNEITKDFFFNGGKENELKEYSKNNPEDPNIFTEYIPLDDFSFIYEQIYEASPNYTDGFSSVDEINSYNQKVCKITVYQKLEPLKACMATLIIGNSIILAFFILIGILLSLIIWRNFKNRAIREQHRMEMTNAVAHNLKTPLCIINGFSENLREESGYLTKQHYINVIQEQANEMDILVHKMLDFSKLETDSAKLNIKSFNIKTELENIAKKYNDISSKNIIVTADDKEIFADKELMELVFENLIENAVKYSKDNSDIEISFVNNNFNISNECDEISKKDLKKIWKPYNRLEKDEEVRGTGIGLSIVKHILKLHRIKPYTEYSGGRLIIGFYI
ncbi:sensor histidine kinase KdpD [uncultured Ruminococcus sp.]|uniref:sensor histidine kinase n=1 Tax=uncultured Ruminococcus sp. TaxID=165186 RepID=UPI0025D70063|nr:HAMP domain-containing sensor histidine kinase [uncultured Ruminococcus sp.]